MTEYSRLPFSPELSEEDPPCQNALLFRVLPLRGLEAYMGIFGVVERLYGTTARSTTAQNPETSCDYDSRLGEERLATGLVASKHRVGFCSTNSVRHATLPQINMETHIVTRIAHRIGNGSYPLSHVQGARE